MSTFVGLVPEVTVPGDFIFLIPELRRFIVARVCETSGPKSRIQFVGTAILVEGNSTDVLIAPSIKPEWYQEDWRKYYHKMVRQIFLDLRTLYIVLAHSRGSY